MRLRKIFSFELDHDIALSRDGTGEFLPWIIALMVYLTTLTLASGFTLNHIITTSHNSQLESFSVNLPHLDNKESADKILNIVKNSFGVKEASITSNEKLKELISPWLGKSEALDNLPLPVIIEVKLVKDTIFDYELLKKKIKEITPNIQIDDHKKWLEQFADLVGIIKIVLFIIALMIISATSFIVIFACKTSLKIHRSTVNLLHRLGAVDAYIAKQFQNYAAFLTLKGSFIGSGLAGATLVGLHIMAQTIKSPLFPSFAFSLQHWLLIFFMPIFMSFLALISARLSVLNNLRKVP